MSRWMETNLMGCQKRPAFTMIEAVISMLVVSLMLVAALNAVGGSRMAETAQARKSKGLLLAQDLMSEILLRAYQDPEGFGGFGLEANESGYSRDDFDDVDDYDQWNASPPENADGTMIIGAEHYSRSVEVYWVNPNNLPERRSTNTGVKQIVVTIKHKDTPVASLTAIRTRAWTNLEATSDSTLENDPPVAIAAGNPLSGHVPLTVNFFAGGSSDSDGDTLAYTWDFGDGSSATGEIVSHTYWEMAEYQVTLTASDGKGGVDTDTLLVKVMY